MRIYHFVIPFEIGVMEKDQLLSTNYQFILHVVLIGIEILR